MQGLGLQSISDKSFEIITVNEMQTKKNDVLVDVKATTINEQDVDLIGGSNQDVIAKALKRSDVITGLEFSGVVKKDSIKFKAGDKVIGCVDLFEGGMSHQETISINEKYLYKMPDKMKFSEVASMIVGLMTAIKALENLAKAKEGMRVLLNGINGSVGTMAIQLCAHLNLKVDIVSRKEYLSMFESFSYENFYENLEDTKERAYDIIFDVAHIWSYSTSQEKLNDKGVYITTNPVHDVLGYGLSLISSTKDKVLLLSKPKESLYKRFYELASTGEFKAVIDSEYNLKDIKEAFTRFSKKGKFGKVVVTVP